HKLVGRLPHLSGVKRTLLSKRVMSALPRNHWSPLRPTPGPSSLLDRAKILGAHFVGCSRGWRSGRNAVPHPIKETPPVRKFKVRARQELQVDDGPCTLFVPTVMPILK